MTALPCIDVPSARSDATCEPALPPTRRSLSHGRNGRSGLTLVEVMVGVFVIGTAALAGLSGLLFSFRLSNSNLNGLVAHSTAVSVAEQIRALGFGGVDADPLPVDIPSIPAGALFQGVWNDRSEDINHTPTVATDDLQMSIRPEITRGATEDGIEIAQVIVRYRWVDRSFFTARTREESLTFLLSSSSTF